MERARFRRLSVRKSEVDRNRQTNFAAAKNVLQEGVSWLNFKFFKRHATTLFRSAFGVVHLVFFLALLKLGQSEHNVAQERVSTWLSRFKEIEFDLTFGVVPCQISWKHVDQIPLVQAVFKRLNFWLVDRLLERGTNNFVDQEKVHSATRRKPGLHLHQNFFFRSTLALFASYFDCAILPGRSLWVDQVSFESLVACGNDFMDGELQAPYKVVVC